MIHSDLKPRGVAVSFIPGLPAYIIFMCLRYADSVNSDQRVSSLLNSTISTIKGVIKVEFIHLICVKKMTRCVKFKHIHLFFVEERKRF